jgi:NAD(P)-dependent dehydrogenase (short-subunit alcohol dehydrogenase family)
VINITSWVAQLGIPFAAVYASTKGALETLTRAWSAEFGTQGVRVNAISPGVMHPSGQMESPAEFMMKGTPAGASGTGDAIAEAALYLASDGAAFVHGSVLSVDGGRTGAAVFAA